ncbi:hypothetical protein EON65_31945 [archaeon]|nr:MAG: hypothetical protein EON65_31945 [archaeon]
MNSKRHNQRRPTPNSIVRGPLISPQIDDQGAQSSLEQGAQGDFSSGYVLRSNGQEDEGEGYEDCCIDNEDCPLEI